MSTMRKIHDIDADLGEDEPVPTTKVKLFDKEWTVPCSVNTFTLSSLQLGSPGAVAAFLVNSVVAEEQDEFAAVLSRQPNLTTEKLLKIVNGLIEAATERPTESPASSSRQATKRTSAPKSAARSSSGRAVRSRA